MPGNAGHGQNAWRGIRAAFVVGLLLVLAGCDEKDDSRAEGAGANEAVSQTPPPWASRKSKEAGFPCDVEEVLSQSCRRCHWEPRENDAPFGMLKYDDTQAMRSGKPIHVLMEQMVAADLMPPLDALVSPKVTPLSPEQKSTLLKWLRAGAPKSAAVCP